MPGMLRGATAVILLVGCGESADPSGDGGAGGAGASGSSIATASGSTTPIPSSSSSAGAISSTSEAVSGQGGGGGSEAQGGGGSGGGRGERESWAHVLSNTRDVTGHPDGGTIVVGRFTGVLAEFGGAPLESEGADGFVVHLDEAGEVAWAVALGAPGGAVDRVRAEPSGEIHVVARTDGPFTFGSSDIEGGGQVVARLGLDGTPLSATLLTDTSDLLVQEIELGDGGQVLMAAPFTSEVTVNGQTLTTEADIAWFVLSLSPDDGSISWVTQLDSTTDGFVDVTSLAPRGGELALVGSFGPALEAGGIELVSVADLDAFFLAVDPDTGEVLRGKRYGGGGNDRVDVARAGLDASLLLAGTTPLGGELDFGGGPLAESFEEKAYVVLLDSSDQVAWQGSWGHGAPSVGSVAVGPDGRIALSATFADVIDFGGGPLSGGSGVSRTGCFAVFDSQGQHVGSWAFDDEDTAGLTVVLGSRLYGTGGFLGAATILGHDLVSVDGEGPGGVLIGFPR